MKTVILIIASIIISFSIYADDQTSDVLLEKEVIMKMYIDGKESIRINFDRKTLKILNDIIHELAEKKRMHDPGLKPTDKLKIIPEKYIPCKINKDCDDPKIY